MEQRRTIRKWFWVWDFEKEERWLNAMAQSGWALDGVGLCTYHFVSCDPGEYAVRLEMRRYDPEYIEFTRETGAEYVGRIFMWVFFRKKSSEGAFDLFSDIDSKVAHLTRIGRVLTAVGLLNLGIGLINTISPSRAGWVNLLCAALLMYALGRIHGKKESLENDRLLHE